MSTVCPPDAYQHEPNAPAHRHDERCRRSAEVRIAELERVNAALVNAGQAWLDAWFNSEGAAALSAARDAMRDAIAAAKEATA